MEEIKWTSGMSKAIVVCPKLLYGDEVILWYGFM